MLGALFAIGVGADPVLLRRGARRDRLRARRRSATPPATRGRSWLNPTSALIGVIAVLTGAYLAAVYLAGDSVRAEQPDLARAFRARALLAGAASGVVAIGGLLVLRSDARALFDGLTSGRRARDGHRLRASAGAATLALVWTERYGLARVDARRSPSSRSSSAGRSPRTRTCCRPTLTLDEAAAADATLQATVIVVGLGMLILGPSLWFLYRLVLSGQLDQTYEPLDQRFHT